MGDKVFKIVGSGVAILASMIAKKVSEGGWKAVMASDPPANPEDPDTKMLEAILWAALSGALIALARMVATRQWTKYYTESAGHKPANPDDVS